MSITAKSKISDIFLLLVIYQFDFQSWTFFYPIKNNKETWLIQMINDRMQYISIPLLPNCKYIELDNSDINKPLQRIELQKEIPNFFDSLISFWDICAKDQCSSLCFHSK